VRIIQLTTIQGGSEGVRVKRVEGGGKEGCAGEDWEKKTITHTSKGGGEKGTKDSTKEKQEKKRSKSETSP